MSCEAENLEELKGWLDEFEQSGRAAVSALRSTKELDSVGAHLNGRASFAIKFAICALDDLADYLVDPHPSAKRSPERVVCKSFRSADPGAVVAQVSASTGVLTEAFGRARLVRVAE